jgi:subtilisin family serine protease
LLTRKLLTRLSLIFLAALALAVPAAAAQPDAPRVNLYLRRATFDPLRATPRVSSSLADSPTRLLLVQFDSVPTAETRQSLEALGLRPLLYVPVNALLVRAPAGELPPLASVPGLRWYGRYQIAYRLPAELDATLGARPTTNMDLRVVAAPDVDADALIRSLTDSGGAVGAVVPGLNGTTFHVRLPASALRAIVQRDDVVWAEPYRAPHILNDRAREVLGVTAARQQASWLTGKGQIVAVSDTGLDVQTNLSADFAGRVVQAFTPQQMAEGDPRCPTTSAAQTWSDRNGHGTHVSGTVLGSGALSPGGVSYAGIAPEARLVVQSFSTGGSYFDCFPPDMSFVAKAYAAGARVQNASWGMPVGSMYTDFERMLDDVLWQHKDLLMVVAAGNAGSDLNKDGVIDQYGISSPGTAKNVLSVGASENNRPPTGSTCAPLESGIPQQNQCWGRQYDSAPFFDDFTSDNPNGMAAFSSRGPALDGRIKPEIVAPGSNVISSASHSTSAVYPYGRVNGDYAYDNGTSMSTPMVSGLAALVRQWLGQARHMTNPSAAMVKALLLNGAVDLSPGQYGTGGQREIPGKWPNNVEGWGRASLPGSLELSGGQGLWLLDERAGIVRSGVVAFYTLQVSAGQPLRFTLAWTDYPASPVAGRTLVNDLDLEIQGPNGSVWRGNASADLPADCRDGVGADRCNNAESVLIAAPSTGTYAVRVRAAAIVQGPQPFALVARAGAIAERPPARLFLPFVAP